MGESVPTIVGIHPYADRFPMLGDDRLVELTESIREIGQQQPIVTTRDGLVLDGRNRLAACQRLGVEPIVEIYEGDDLAGYVIAANVERRHQSTGSLAMSTALVLVDAGRRREGRWKRGSVDIGESSNIWTWRKAMDHAGVVLDYAPDLAQRVVDGDLALDAAYRDATDRRDAEREKLAEVERRAAEEADARVFIEDRDPDLAARVDGRDLQTYAEARAIWEQRNREEAERIRREEAETEKREREARRGRSDLYSGIARSVEHLSVYGRYERVGDVMADFDPTELVPESLASAYEPASLTSARRFIDSLIEWSGSDR